MQTPNPHLKRVAALLFLAASFSATHAELIVYSDQAAFVSSVSPTALESFEGVPDRDLSSSPIVSPSVILTAISGQMAVHSSPEGGHYPTDGERYVAGSALAAIRLTFPSPIRAFGITITDWGDANTGSLTVKTNAGELAGGLVIATNPPRVPSAGEQFFGFQQVAEFTEVVLTSTSNHDGFGIDEIRFTRSPVPSTLLSSTVFTGPKAGVIAVLSRSGRIYRLHRTTSLSDAGVMIEEKSGTGRILLFTFDDSDSSDKAAFFYVSESQPTSQ